MRNNRLLLPWPDSRLSGNSTAHWRQKKNAKDIEKTSTLKVLRDNPRFSMPSGLVSLRVVFFPPNKRRRDDDNWYIALKPARDTIFAECGRDDSEIRLTIIEWGFTCRDGAVGLEYTPFDDYEKESVAFWRRNESWRRSRDETYKI